MFETVGTMLGSINLLGMGIFLVITALAFAIAKGMTRNIQDTIIMFIMMVSVGIVLLFENDAIQTALYITAGLMIIIYGLKFIISKRTN